MNSKTIFAFFFLAALSSCYGQSWEIFNTPTVALGRSFPSEYLLYEKDILAEAVRGRSVQRGWMLSVSVPITKVMIFPIVPANPAREIRVRGGPDFNQLRVIIKSKISKSIMYRIQVYATETFLDGAPAPEETLSPVEIAAE